MEKINELNRRRDTLIEYLKSKLDIQDWHGIRDACVDIEVIESAINTLQGQNKK